MCVCVWVCVCVCGGVPNAFESICVPIKIKGMHVWNHNIHETFAFAMKRFPSKTGRIQKEIQGNKEKIKKLSSSSREREQFFATKAFLFFFTFPFIL